MHKYMHVLYACIYIYVGNVCMYENMHIIYIYIFLVGLPIIIISALLIAWYFEKPRRGIGQWFADNIKQGFSGFLLHFLGTVLAIELEKIEKADNVNTCDW